MVPVLSLWLPILLSAVLVFVASSVLHMLFRYHATDYQPVPGEEEVGAAIRSAQVPPGDYTMPYAGSTKVLGSPAFAEKMERGPVLLMTVRAPGPVRMGRTLATWFVFTLVVSVFSGYLASRGAVPAGDAASAFRFAGTTAFVAYGLGTWSESIWFGRKWSTTLKNTFDGLVYALITGGVFAWLWPPA